MTRPRTTIVRSVQELDPWLEAWDSLAVAAGRPYSAPGWLIPWFEHMRPPGSSLYVVIVSHGDTLAGVAPFFAQPGRLGGREIRLLGSGISSGADLLADESADDAVALADALGDARPSLVSFESVDASTRWPNVLKAHWPGSLPPHLTTTGTRPSPSLVLSVDEPWTRRRSGNLRGQLTQARRRLTELDGRISQTEGEDVATAVDAFVRLHHSRWTTRGGSNLPADATRAMLNDVARRLPPDRLRVFVARTRDGVIAVEICVAAGGRMAFWNGGWDERHGRLRPGLVTLAAAIDDAERRGDRIVDLGGGDDHYKLRLADKPFVGAVKTQVLVPTGVGVASAYATLLPHVARRRARQAIGALPETWETKIRATHRRLRRRASA